MAHCLLVRFVFFFKLDRCGDSGETFGGCKLECLASGIAWGQLGSSDGGQSGLWISATACAKIAADTCTSMLAGPADLVDKLTGRLDAISVCSILKSLPRLGVQVGA